MRAPSDEPRLQSAALSRRDNFTSQNTTTCIRVAYEMEEEEERPLFDEVVLTIIPDEDLNLRLRSEVSG